MLDFDIEYDPFFSRAIGGYPRGSRVKVDNQVFVSLIDDNLDDPRVDFPTTWEPADA